MQDKKSSRMQEEEDTGGAGYTEEQDTGRSRMKGTGVQWE